jgi:hypothetical protein
LVAAAHPHRYNRLGQARWSGFIYGGPRPLALLLRPLIYHGYQGTASYQSVLHRRAEATRDWVAALLPVFVLFGVVGALLGEWWHPGWWLAAASASLSAVYGVAIAASARPSRGEPSPVRYRSLVAFTHVTQPLVRAWGRVVRKPARRPQARNGHDLEWSGDRFMWLSQVEQQLAASGCRVRVGGPHDRWDLEVSRGLFVAQKLTLAILWGWTPAHARRVRLRVGAWAAVAAVGVAFALETPWAWVLMGAGLVAVVAEGMWLRSLVSKALRTTTAGAV